MLCRSPKDDGMVETEANEGELASLFPCSSVVESSGPASVHICIRAQGARSISDLFGL
jgi:hypothetical protein